VVAPQRRRRLIRQPDRPGLLRRHDETAAQAVGVGEDRDVRIHGQHGRNAAAMVVVAVAQHEGVGCGQVDAQPPGVAGERAPLPRVEQDAPTGGLDPEGEAVLRRQGRRRLVVHQDGQGRFGCRHRVLPLSMNRARARAMVLPARVIRASRR